MAPIAQFAALADETRCRVLELLCARPRPVHELAEEFAISRPAISRHLRVLKEAGLVREEKRGRENVYAFRPTGLGAAGRWLGRFGSPAVARPRLERRPKAKARPSAPPAMPDLFDFTT